jgi:hypothetical protein
LGIDEMVAQARQARREAPLGFGGEADAVTRYKFKDA